MLIPGAFIDVNFEEVSLGSVAATFIALGVIFAGIFALYRVMKRVESAIGVDSEGRTISDRMSRVEHQLWPNGGTSLADKVDDSAERLHSLEACGRETQAKVEIIRDMLVALVESGRVSDKRESGRGAA